MAIAMGAISTMPGFLVGPTATCLALVVLLYALVASVTLAMVQMQPKRLEEHVQRLSAKKCCYTQGLQVKPGQLDAVDTEAAITAQPKSRKKKSQRSKKKKLLQYFIAADCEDEDEERAPEESWGELFNLDDNHWLAPNEPRQHAPGPAVHFIGDEVPPANSECHQKHRNGSVDAFSLDDDVWLTPSTQM